MNGRAGLVWVNGPWYGHHYLLQEVTGEVSALLRLSAEYETSGFGTYCGRTFVALHVGDEDGVKRLYLRIGPTRFPVDGATRVDHRRRWAGLASRAVVRRRDWPTATVRCSTLWRGLMGRLDVAYDEHDEYEDDFLWRVSRVVNDEEARLWVLDRHEVDAGPWDVAGG